ncbi:hypothetical protein HKD37_15G043507 [Glycine soja]|nr:hypothetical protein GmHk_15G044506 [Glycine max]
METKKKYGSRDLPIMWLCSLLRNQVNRSSPYPRGPHLPRREPLLVPLLPGPQANLRAMRPLP